jgi:hypothetical protein
MGKCWVDCRKRRSTVLAAAITVAVVATCGCIAPAVSEGAFHVQPGSFAVRVSSNQAGAHADLTASFAFAENQLGSVEGDLRNAEVVLPLGVAGYPTAVKTCDPVQLQLEECPLDAQIGTIEVVLRAGLGVDVAIEQPLYNMVPPPEETAVYGFVIGGVASGELTVSLDSENRVKATTTNLFGATEVVRESLTVWGVPADPGHDAQRGSHFVCSRLNEGPYECKGGGSSADENPTPYLVNPTACTEKPLVAELEGVESWAGEKSPAQHTYVGPFTGCGSLRFQPTIAVAPEQTQATSPTGYEIDVKVPQTEGAESLVTSDLRDAVVRMPAGVVFSPSAGTGLESCSEAQIGLGTEQEAHCPAASKIGTVTLITPAVSGELKGAIYLGGPPSGPIAGPPFTLYLTFAGHGVLVKIRGSATPNPATGQVTTAFEENPELPFSELKLRLHGGSRAMLANPSACLDSEGRSTEYSAESDLTPWGSPFVPDATPVSPPFELTGCLAPRFTPAFTAGTLSNQAGGYTTLRVDFSREDAEQSLGEMSLTTPPGLAGDLSKIPLCPEPQASLGTCPEASLIGEETAAAGPGPEPTFIKGGKVYLTGPYRGAPFGLAIDVAEQAGPFDLGSGLCDCEVVRASVGIDPHTAQLKITTGALPSMKDGIPLQVKSVDLDIDRPEFMFNPTSCDPMSVTGTLESTQGALAQESSHYQATNCAALAFKPRFEVSTSGRTSRNEGASLDVKLSFPDNPQGSEANLALVKVELPKRLAARLSTLQNACPVAVFQADPAGCPVGSIVGIAKAVTPIVPAPLVGPAIFVSNGGQAFPSLTLELQGYGVRVELVGSTLINRKTDITTVTFKSMPDIFLRTFELYLPDGPHSALGASGSLCRVGPLTMPTEFISQDSNLIRRSTKILVTGCANPKGARGKRASGAGRSRRTSRARAKRVRRSASGPSRKQPFPTG